jgi:hypothetical protein
MTNLLDLMDRGLGGVAFKLEDLAPQLEAYGESEAASKLLTVDAATHAQISVVAGKYAGLGHTMDKSICLAAVEVFEGHPRELRRKRRKSSR